MKMDFLTAKLPKYFLEKYQMIGTVTFSTLFAIVFLNIYIPFSNTAWFGLGRSSFFLFTAGFIFISLLILIASRVLMYKSKAYFEMTYVVYVSWSILEVVLICLFYTFVTMDVQPPQDMTFSQIFSKSLFYGAIALIIPYILSGMYFAIIDKNKTIKLMNSSGVVTEDPASGDTGELITLFDNKGELKLSVKASNLFYIESDDNYINVWYTDNKGELHKYMLRCRLKTVEENFRNSSLLMRCHRKYIVNAAKVKVLRKESSGYFLDMENSTIQPIPVTKTYLPNILERFS